MLALFCVFSTIFAGKSSPQGKYVAIQTGYCEDDGYVPITQTRDCQEATNAMGSQFANSYSKTIRSSSWSAGCLYSGKSEASFMIKEKQSTAERNWVRAGSPPDSKPKRKEAGVEKGKSYTYFCIDPENEATESPEEESSESMEASSKGSNYEDYPKTSDNDPGCGAKTGCSSCMAVGSGYDCVWDRTTGSCKFAAGLGSADMRNDIAWMPTECKSTALFMVESVTTQDFAVYLFALIGLGAGVSVAYKQFKKFTAATKVEMTTYDTVVAEEL